MIKYNTPGTGIIVCDEKGFVYELFSDGQASFDIFWAGDWPGPPSEGLAYAKIITESINNIQKLKEIL